MALMFLCRWAVSLVWPLVEDLFTYHANEPGGPPALVPSVGLFNILLSGPSFKGLPLHRNNTFVALTPEIYTQVYKHQ